MERERSEHAGPQPAPSRSVGEPLSDGPLEAELRITLFPERMEIPWSQCTATATFTAAEVADAVAARGAGDATAAHATADYVLNELVENAVKFGKRGRICIRAGLSGADLAFEVSNEVDPGGIESLMRQLEALATCDAQDAMVARVEANFANDDEAASGLGFLTMRSDYDARLGFSIRPSGDVPGGAVLRSSARVRLA